MGSVLGELLAHPSQTEANGPRAAPVNRFAGNRAATNMPLAGDQRVPQNNNRPAFAPYPPPPQHPNNAVANSLLPYIGLAAQIPPDFLGLINQTGGMANFSNFGGMIPGAGNMLGMPHSLLQAIRASVLAVPPARPVQQAIQPTGSTGDSPRSSTSLPTPGAPRAQLSPEIAGNSSRSSTSPPTPGASAAQVVPPGFTGAPSNSGNSSSSLPTPGIPRAPPRVQFQYNTFPCVVCGELAMGVHYGVFSCDRCKAFFCRAAKYGTPPCRVDPFLCGRYNKGSCTHCRLKRCYDVGMRLPENSD